MQGRNGNNIATRGSNRIAPANGRFTTRSKVNRGPANEPVFHDPKDYITIALTLLEDQFAHHHRHRLLNSDSVFFAWKEPKWRPVKDDAVRSLVYKFLHDSLKHRVIGEVIIDDAPRKYRPNSRDVNNVIDALRAVTHEHKQPPTWLSSEEHLPDPLSIIPAKNGLIRLDGSGAKMFHIPTPMFFSTNALDYNFDPMAGAHPKAWLKFLDQLWPDDRESIEFLQEWFGYCLTRENSQQKALLMVGPKRAGKGTIARVLQEVIGPSNVAGPTLQSLGRNFGLWPLIGKQLAIIADVRISGRSDLALITEMILSITGQDAITIDRKNLEPLTTILNTRLMILTNELPHFTDASGALASRFIPLVFEESFYGREDTKLVDRICTEKPALLNWAIEGWKRLQNRGRFAPPTSSSAASDELNDLMSPCNGFIRDCCQKESGASVEADVLFNAWCAWCKDEKHDPGSKQLFWRDIRNALGIYRTESKRVKEDNGNGEEKRQRFYPGVRLTLAAREQAARFMAQKEEKERTARTSAYQPKDQNHQKPR